MTVLGETTGTGTAVTFKPDPEMFDTLVYDYETCLLYTSRCV